MAVIRVLVAENHAFVGETIVRVLKDYDDIDVVGLVCDGAEAVDAASCLEPDLVVLDMHIPGLRALEATRRIREAASHTAVLILGIEMDDVYVEAALEAGAAGYLSKTIRSQGLVDAVRRAGRGEIVSFRRSTCGPRDSVSAADHRGGAGDA